MTRKNKRFPKSNPSQWRKSRHPVWSKARGSYNSPRPLISPADQARLTAKQCVAIARRQRLVERYLKLIDSGLSGSTAAKLCGISRSTIWRYRNRDLCPAVPGCGRRSLFAQFAVPKEVLARVKQLISEGLSTHQAWRLVAVSSDTPQPLASYLKAVRHLPPSFIKAVPTQKPRKGIV